MFGRGSRSFLDVKGMLITNDVVGKGNATKHEIINRRDPSWAKQVHYLYKLLRLSEENQSHAKTVLAKSNKSLLTTDEHLKLCLN